MAKVMRALADYTIPKRASARLRRQLEPDAIRLFYFSALRALMARAHARVASELMPMLYAIRADSRPLLRVVRADSDEEPGFSQAQLEAFKVRLEEIKKEFEKETTKRKLTPLAQEVAQRTADFQRGQLFKQVKDTIGVDPFITDEGLAEAAAKFTAENVSLIQSVPERYFAGLEQAVEDGVQEGQRSGTIAKEMETRYGVAESDAKRIANDQVGKFFGSLNDTRLQDLGITTAVWRTVHDNRVRDSHSDLDGQQYDLGEGLLDAQTGEMVIPGQAIQCRCFCEPDLSELLG